jgi:anti-sigma B factor antagonist
MATWAARTAQITKPVVVAFPDEFDISNAGDLAKQMRAAITPEVSAVIADLTTTVPCDSSGLRVIVLAYDWAKADQVELRLAAPPGSVLVVMKLVGLDQLVPIYPSLDKALAGEPIPGQGAMARTGSSANLGNGHDAGSGVAGGAAWTLASSVISASAPQAARGVMCGINQGRLSAQTATSRPRTLPASRGLAIKALLRNRLPC